MIYLGGDKIGKLYLGDTEIGKAYLGDTLVFQKGGGPTPPPGPQPVFYERLVFDKTAFIQTNITIPANGSIAVPLGNETLKGNQYVFNFVQSTGEGAVRFMLGGSTSSTRRQLVVYYDSSSYLESTHYLDFTNATYNLFLTPKGYGYGTAFYTYTKGSSHPSGGLCVGFNSSTSTSTVSKYSGTVGYIRVFNSDAQNVQSYSGFANYTPAATLRPCLYEDQAGLWCMETNTFYGNSAAAGTITVAGNIVTL